jgi:hypothetical protein
VSAAFIPFCDAVLPPSQPVEVGSIEAFAAVEAGLASPRGCEAQKVVARRDESSPRGNLVPAQIPPPPLPTPQLKRSAPNSLVAQLIAKFVAKPDSLSLRR